MDINILKPEITQIGNRFYRRLDRPSNAAREPQRMVYKEETEEDYYQDEPSCSRPEPDQEQQPRVEQVPSRRHEPDEGQEEMVDIEVEMEESKAGFTGWLPVARGFYGRILGQRAQTKKRLSQETQTNIYVPFDKDAPVIRVEGKTRASVLKCAKRILEIVDSARQRSEFTHFVSIPFNVSHVRDKFESFKDQVLSSCHSSRGISEDLFQNPSRLHLTICMLSLFDEKEREKAGQVLQSFADEVLKPRLEAKDGGLKVQLKGIDYMNDDPDQVSVLYAEVADVEPEAELGIQRLADELQARFKRSGLLVGFRDEKVKLHVTLMNTKLQENREETGRSNHGKKPLKSTFDARQLLKKFSDFDFREVTVSTINVSIRHYFDSQGYYKCSSKITL